MRKFNLYCYSCGFSTTTIEYSCQSVFVCVFLHVRLCVCVHNNSKNNKSIHMKLPYIAVYGNSSDEFDIGHCQAGPNELRFHSS